ncbi:MAG TPA: glucoamylase family protein [Opitutaceae bacterium]|nr:glucoamylase family protein [Opitutaceae bacterium]
MGIPAVRSRSAATIPSSLRLAPLGRGRGVRAVIALAAMALAGATASPAARTAADVPALTAQDTALLDEIERRAVLFFIEHTDPVTGLTRDRAPKDGTLSSAPASIAATGFALTAWCIADARGWLPPGEARTRVQAALRFAADRVEHERGWFYHFVGARDGRRVWRCEASTIDTALFLQGALMAREYLRDAETTALVARIYERIDWQWALNGGTTLSHGWRPETGFIPHRWDSYSELMGLYLLGIGAPRDGLQPESWHAWSRGPRAEYEGGTFLQGGPLFTHQYAQAWFDFRGSRDAHADYWQNSVHATLAQRAWSARQSDRYAHWSDEMWGLTASDSADGYRAWGTPGHENESADGTLVPCAPGGSLPFAPRECLTALARMREAGGPAVWGRYGFADAFNPQTGWSSPDVIGIDVGITLIMAENLRSGLVWQEFMRAPEVRRGMALAGFRPVQPVAGAAAVALTEADGD